MPVGELLSLIPASRSRNEYTDTQLNEEEEHTSLGNTLRLGPVTGRVNLLFRPDFSPVEVWKVDESNRDLDIAIDSGSSVHLARIAMGFYTTPESYAAAVQAALVAAVRR